ncbi:hypothetical protein [Lacticaseibacillus parakribbianus]|uniref:hypothetical protein n=1 Tax=Lacticaseibacillus parakribbianus TaxID=2970927 RepID=UPI0021CB0EF5|nr:hypothetical protein [Lacticaseibacillus parakribbianus]
MEKKLTTPSDDAVKDLAAQLEALSSAPGDAAPLAGNAADETPGATTPTPGAAAPAKAAPPAETADAGAANPVAAVAGTGGSNTAASVTDAGDSNTAASASGSADSNTAPVGSSIATVTQNPQPTGDADLQAQIDELRRQLAAQTPAGSFTAALAPNQKHWIQALRFFQANPLMLFAVAWVAVFLPAWWATWLMLAYMVLCYAYPLLTRKTRFGWDRRLDDWLADPEVRRRQNQQQLARLNQVKDELSQQAGALADSVKNARGPVAAGSADAATSSAQATGDQATSAQATGAAGTQPVGGQSGSAAAAGQPIQAAAVALPHQPLFTNNLELWLGLVVGVVGYLAQQQGGQGVTDGIGQLQAVIQSGSLSSDGYVFIWGYLAVRIGVLAVVGGLVKGLMHKANGGAILKALAVLAGAAAAAAASYVYAHPFASAYQAARAAYESGASLDDIGNLATMVQYLPVAVMVVYGVGILLNLLGRNHE